MNRNLLGNIGEIICQYWRRLLLAFFLVLLSNLLLILNPLILRQALLIFSQSGEKGGFLANILHAFLGSAIHSVYSWMTLLIAIASLSALSKYYMRTIFIALGRQVELTVREKVFQRIQAQSRAFFDRHEIGDLLSRLTNDITAYRDLLGPGLMYPLFFLTLVIPSLLALASLSPWMALVSLVPIATIFLFNFVIRSSLYRLSQQVQEFLGKMSVMAHEHYSGIRLIKAYGIQKATLQLFYRLCGTFSRFNMRLACLQGMIAPSLNLIIKIVTVLLVLLVGALILLQWQPMSMADFLSFMWIQSYIFSPLLMLGWVIPMYQRGKAAYDRLVEICEEPIEVQDVPEGLAFVPPHADLELHQLTFTYPGQSMPVLHHVNLRIAGGSFVGLTGPIGAGKSTLIRLLNREYEVPKNAIRIGGRDIHDYSLQALHQAIACVEQLPFLFSKTLADNIRFGKREATKEEIEEIARLVDLHETVLTLPEQYNTLVGERGVSLSGGQKQRVAIARALLVNRSILLLDDIFSALDATTEKRIFEAIKKNFRGKTLLLVTHRVSILEQLDRILYLHGGRIVEDGSPSELVRRQGFYEALVNIQKRYGHEI
jgi:ATP-binding cassette subfamily B protein